MPFLPVCDVIVDPVRGSAEHLVHNNSDGKIFTEELTWYSLSTLRYSLAMNSHNSSLLT